MYAAIPFLFKLLYEVLERLRLAIKAFFFAEMRLIDLLYPDIDKLTPLGVESVQALLECKCGLVHLVLQYRVFNLVL